jgi:soluble lytic murein transglycosylase
LHELADELDSPARHYGAGLELAAVDRHAAAVVAFTAAIVTPSPLSAFAMLGRSRSLEELGDDDAARMDFEAAVLPGELPNAIRARTQFALAELDVAAGRTSEARSVLTDLERDAGLSSTERAEAAWQIAGLLRDDGVQEWADAARRAIGLAPWSGAARQALEALEADQQPVPALSAGYVYYLARDNATARDRYEALLASDPDRSSEAIAWFYLGALAERRGERFEAIDAYAASLVADPAGRLADDARYWRGRVLDELGEYAAAAIEYGQVVEQYPTSSFAGDSVVRAAVATSHTGAVAEASAMLELASEIYGGDTASWAARWLHVLHGRDSTLEALPVDQPATIGAGGSGLGALLGRREDVTLPEVAYAERPAPSRDDGSETTAWLTATFGDDSAGTGMPPATRDAADQLLRAGDREHARAVLLDAADAARGTPGQLIAIAEYASQLDLHDIALISASRALSPLSDSERSQAPLSVLQLMYPAPYMDYVLLASDEWQLPPLLLLALVRQESAFNPLAGSSAGALGLTQVIGPTGQEIARRLGEPWEPDALFEPRQSLRYGAFYLAQQLEAFEGDLFAALSAYNGGPGSAQRWLDTQPSAGPDAYVFTIDFVETRAFVELVGENYGWYRFIYGAAAEPSLP